MTEIEIVTEIKVAEYECASKNVNVKNWNEKRKRKSNSVLQEQNPKNNATVI